MKIRTVALASLLLAAVSAAHAQTGKALYDAVCAGCHAAGVIGAPKPGDAEAWKPRLAKGKDVLVRNAILGTNKGMPPKGGREDLSDAQIRSAVEFMIAGLPAPAAAKAEPKAPAQAAAAAPAAPRAAAPAAPVAQAAPAPAPKASATPAPAAAPAAPATAPAPPATAARGVVSAESDAADVNAFNRLLKPGGGFNRPAMESGIHDPTNDATPTLQPPSRAFASLPKSPAGNHVDWVKALETKRIDPRWDRNDPKASAVVMDLNIVREVKGSMPDVVYPHKQHTEWLDCSNCHPSIFIPQKGANQISMAAILLGQKCGACHGRVAFPVSECRLCHSKKKDPAAVAAGK
jgi:c(7)-type cytochrome triheme protein